MSVQVVQFTVAGAAMKPFEFARPYAVIYDGHCRVCTRLSRMLQKWDKTNQLQIIPSQAPGVRDTFPFIAPRDYDESLQMIGPGMQRWQGAAAVEQILTVLPKGMLLGWIFRIPFARPIADRFYRWFARNRYKLGCGEHCTYRPPAEEKAS
jgi:predicted DCC family thiol-disulfide oxidoreductase YuxK